MRGSINLVVRKGGKVKSSLSHAHVITQLFNPAVYDGSNKELLELLTAHAVDPIGTGITANVAPFDLGIVVIDHDRKSLLDMQKWCPVQVTSLIRQMRPWAHVSAAGQRGWLGSALYNALTDEILTDLPEHIFASPETLAEWSQAAAITIAGNATGRPPLASFKLQPPGWTFREFSQGEASALQQYLQSAGFDDAAEAGNLWSNWSGQQV